MKIERERKTIERREGPLRRKKCVMRILCSKNWEFRVVVFPSYN
jgi:hypothetical protein